MGLGIRPNYKAPGNPQVTKKKKMKMIKIQFFDKKQQKNVKKVYVNIK